MAVKQALEAQNPLILRCNRLMEAFAKSDDERDFYLDRYEGFLIYVDLDKPDEDLKMLEKELEVNGSRYCMIPKLTFYETKKIMEGFINEKVYDIDTKEKLLDIIQSKEARENFLEFIYDHHSELEKWQSFYQERSRIRIIEWLRANHFHFVFEEDLELPKILLEKLKKELFQNKVGKDILTARKTLVAKSKTYYSNEALNPRPKRGRPPKQAQKTEIEPQITTDIYTTVPNGLRGFLFIPDLTSASSATFSSKFGNEEDLFTNRRPLSNDDISVESLNQKLAALRNLSTKWKDVEEQKKQPALPAIDFDEEDEEDEEEGDFAIPAGKPSKINGYKSSPGKIAANKAAAKNIAPSAKKPANKIMTKTAAKQPAKKAPAALKKKTPMKKAAPLKKAAPRKAKPAAVKKPVVKKQKALRPIMKLKKRNR